MQDEFSRTPEGRPTVAAGMGTVLDNYVQADEEIERIEIRLSRSGECIWRLYRPMDDNYVGGVEMVPVR